MGIDRPYDRIGIFFLAIRWRFDTPVFAHARVKDRGTADGKSKLRFASRLLHDVNLLPRSRFILYVEEEVCAGNYVFAHQAEHSTN